jgi:hypothetical protein
MSFWATLNINKSEGWSDSFSIAALPSSVVKTDQPSLNFVENQCPPGGRKPKGKTK